MLELRKGKAKLALGNLFLLCLVLLLISIAFFFVVNLWKWGGVSQNIVENYQAGGNLTDEARATFALSINNLKGFFTSAFIHENNFHIYCNILFMLCIFAFLLILEAENPALKFLTAGWLLVPAIIFQLLILLVFFLRHGIGYYDGLSAFEFLAIGFLIVCATYRWKQIWAFWRARIKDSKEKWGYWAATILAVSGIISIPGQFAGILIPNTQAQESLHIIAFLIGLLAGIVYAEGVRKGLQGKPRGPEERL